jgi:AcrR family transcriptional regulator
MKALRDAEATRRRLIDAARVEFAEHGIAGARVDRIAADAQANKAQIYHYFGNKDRLFDAMWESTARQILEATPLDVDDLPGFAARLAETYAGRPEIMRLVTWKRLERGDDPPEEFALERNSAILSSIAQAQAHGTVSGHFPAPVLFSLIVMVASLWETMSPNVLAVVDIPDDAKRREIIRDAVERLLAEHV